MSKKSLGLAALIIITMILSACGGASNSLLNTEWQWFSITSGIAKDYVDNPEDYVLVFYEDGTFNGTVDCNVIAGSYEIVNGRLTMALGPTTLAECGPDSQYESLIGKLDLVDSYEVEDSKLTLFLVDGSTRLGFVDGGPAE